MPMLLGMFPFQRDGNGRTDVETLPVEAEEPQADVEESPVEAEEPPVTQSPFTLPEGYQVVEANAFIVAVPGDWRVEKGYFQDTFSFRYNDDKIGETEILGWFDSETWRDFKPGPAGIPDV